MFSAMPQIPGLKILQSLEQLGLLCPVKNVFWIICTSQNYLLLPLQTSVSTPYQPLSPYLCTSLCQMCIWLEVKPICSKCQEPVCCESSVLLLQNTTWKKQQSGKMMLFIQFSFCMVSAMKGLLFFSQCKLICCIVGSAGSGSQVRYSMSFVSPTLLLSSKFHVDSARWLKQMCMSTEEL